MPTNWLKNKNDDSLTIFFKDGLETLSDFMLRVVDGEITPRFVSRFFENAHRSKERYFVYFLIALALIKLYNSLFPKKENRSCYYGHNQH